MRFAEILLGYFWSLELIKMFETILDAKTYLLLEKWK